MKHLAAYLLLTLGGNAKPAAADIEKLLSSVGIEADSDRLEKLVSELEGKDINEVRDTIYARVAYIGRVANSLSSSSPRARPSSPPSPRAVVLLVVPVVPPLAVPPRRPRRRRRRSVSGWTPGS